MEVGREIRRIRQERGLSLTKAAARADMAASALSMIENGHRNPSMPALSKIADALDVTVGDLFPKGQSPLPFDEPERASAVDFEAYARAMDSFTRYWTGEVAERRTLDRQAFHDYVVAVQAIVLSLREVMRAADARDRSMMQPTLLRFVVVASAVSDLAQDKDAAAAAKLAETVAHLKAA